MTTTIFRKYKETAACMASDSRVTWIDSESNLPMKWFDSSDFLKTLVIDDVMYGFAGTNAMFKIFLMSYTSKEESDFVLDTVIQVAKQNNLNVFIMRYDDPELKLFAYSKDKGSSGEIFRISSDPVIDEKIYAIGSGKFSKEYKNNRRNRYAHQPIHKIISANRIGLKKAGMLELCKKVSSGVLTPEESGQAVQACMKKGGDLFTGGEVNMTKNATKQEIMKQVAILDSMDKQAKASGAICASPVYTDLEVSQLESLGQYAVTSNPIDQSDKRVELLGKMQSILDASV